MVCCWIRIRSGFGFGLAKVRSCSFLGGRVTGRQVESRLERSGDWVAVAWLVADSVSVSAVSVCVLVIGCWLLVVGC